MDVNKLSVDVQRLLSASAKVNNYRRAVEELVYNSLDAESTCIAIRIHIQKNWMQVVDNGIGIKKADYVLLGERYATSKLFDINTLKAVPSKHGYQGQALANIIEVSKEVKVTSRCADSSDTWVKMFVDGKIERECFKAPVRPSKGTTVEVNGFLYNLRIQKKNINTFDELQDIKTFLQQLSLVFSNVSISLRDDSENEIIFKMHKNRDIHQTLKSLFDINTNEYQELQVEKNDYKVKALIGVDKSRLTNYNWIYLNNKFLSASNLHKVINNKFGKQNSMKQRKNKTKVIFKCNGENTILCDLVPFYFIFITCPYYEYDMVYSGKHATIEFKDWTQINKLIAKLIKFYNGDVNLEKLKPKQVSSKPKNTEDEVKKIMDKFLGKYHKLRVSQMQNGIKGKKIKRKRNKQKTNISLTKIIPPKCARTDTQDKSLENINNVKLYKNKTNKQITNSRQLNTVKHYSKSNGSNKQANLRHKGIAKTKNIKMNRKISKPIKCKCNKKYDNLTEMFKNETHSTKKRCNELLWGLKDYFNNTGFEKNHDMSLPHMQYKPSATNINFPDTLKAKHLSQKAEAKQIRSYDLLQTIISTQQGFYNQKSRKKDCCVPVNKSTAEIQSYSKTYSYAPNYFASKQTFESHHYNIDHAVIEKEVRPKVQFISKQSIDNFDIGAEEQDRNIQVKTTNSKHHFNSKTEKKHYIKKLNTLLDRCNDDDIETSLSIDLTGTNTVEICKQIRNQVINDMNSLFINEDCDKIYSTESPHSQFNYGINLNIERTYTILVDSFYNPSQADILLDNNNKIFIDETITYTNVRNNDTINRDQAYKTSTDIFMSELSHTSQVNADEPLKVCEAILNSSKDTENFNNSFIEVPRIDSLFHTNADSNTSINKSKINGSPVNSATIEPIKTNEEDNGNINVVFNVSNQIRYSTEKFCSYKIDTELDNSAYNFKLNSRHRFVPKGMSQIFKNCNAKNICSYNLDTEYYEHKIYNKFVENIAVNSEIYEPNVRNLKEFATEHIQKTTEKLNKQNADLIFETDSLRNAKVVLGQVDCKFISAIIQDVAETRKSSEFLVCFDQHAVDERIRLEKNLSYYVRDNNWKKTTIETISVKSSKDEILYLHNHKDKFSRFGLDWTIISDSEILVNAIPEAIRGKNPRPIDVIIKAVQDLISEQMHAIKYLKGNVSLYPKSIMNLVFSEACRSAIKFGDNLSRKDCILLIAELADCKTPFQCAHGRPVMAVMVELNNDSVEYKINMDNLKQFQNRTKKLWN